MGTFTDSEFSGNTATNGGGLLGEYYSTLTLYDTVVDGNTASTYGGGALATNRSSLYCERSSGADGGFTNNTASSYGSATITYSNSSQESVGCDFGSGSDDNVGSYEIYHSWGSYGTYSAGNNATFSCPTTSRCN